MGDSGSMSDQGKISYRVTWQDHAGSISTIVLKSEVRADVEELAASHIRGCYYGSFTILRVEEASCAGWRDVSEYTAFYSG